MSECAMDEDSQMSHLVKEIHHLSNEIPDSSQLLEFDILDEDSGSTEENRNDYSSNTESEYDINEDKIDAMLEESLKCSTQRKENDCMPFEEKEKIVLKVKGQNHFDILPEGWIEVSHNSGMPVYLHRQTRVCSLSKPYFLGPGSARKHEIPLSAIPCLQYLKDIEKEKQTIAEKNEPAKDTDNRSIVIPNVKVECVEINKKNASLNNLAVREYCQKRFEFETIKVKRFKTWFDRRTHLKELKRKQRPSLPENTKLITCPLPCISDNGQISGSNANSKKEFIMNPSGKSAVCILHEYIQHILKVAPTYIYKELENASTPYSAVVMIENMEYGLGFGSSKKQAKSEAAKASLEILIPNVCLFGSDDKEKKNKFQDVEFFDQVSVEDPRVCDLCVKAGQPYPYQILLECVKRNYGMGDTDICMEMKNLNHQKNEFTMKVGKHASSIICKNKRDGKQRTSQALLQKLHPHIISWGSLLRMYGVGSRQTLKEKKVEERCITELQNSACANMPNISILNKLKEEMMKYQEKKKAMEPLGKLIPENLVFSAICDSNLTNLEL